MAMGGSGIMDFVQRFQALQLQRDTSDELIKDLLIYCERIESSLRQENQRLNGQNNDLQLDLADATKSRRELQQRLRDMEAQVEYASQKNDILKNRNPYVIILIDGDGLLFQDSFIRQGIEGGKKAAYALRSAILDKCGDQADDIEVIAKVCANLSGLSKAMRRHGSLENESDLKDFSLGFTQCLAAFDFIDIGYGKERADSKIKEATRWNLRNVNCKQILLGISHDAGYAPFLDEILRDEATRSLITIVEGFPTVRELVETEANIMNFNNMPTALFRSDKLVDRGHQQMPSNHSISPTPVRPSIATPAGSTTSSGPISYAGAISNASPPPQLSFPLAPKSGNAPARQKTKSDMGPTKGSWNPGVRGLDPPIPINQTALDGIKKRKDSSKLCNNHYLRGPCAKGDSCCFEHKYKPNADEINAIAFLARLNPCTNGQDCDVEDCIYGHHCPSTVNGICTHPYCKFRPEEHAPGTKMKSKVYEGY